jgi:hypothetical protein
MRIVERPAFATVGTFPQGQVMAGLPGGTDTLILTSGQPHERSEEGFKRSAED